MSAIETDQQLAVEGSPPVRRAPLPPWPHYHEDEIEAVAGVLRSGRVNYWTGDEVRAFEADYAANWGVDYAVALANGTVALELALYALDIGPGDEVVVTPRTFMASASSIALRGARPVFADVDPDSQNITAATIEAVLTPRTRAIIAVHLAGWPCEMDPILELARDRKLAVIEDCAQAHGASYRGRPVGTLGQMGAFSFCQDKILSTGGEGGMLITGNPQLWERAWSYKDHGKSWQAVHSPAQSQGFRWLHKSFGTNWRLTAMQAAIGRRQLVKLPEWRACRARNAALLAQSLADLPGLRVPLPPEHVEHAWYKFYAFVSPEVLGRGWDRDRIMAAIHAEGIPCFSGACPEVYLEKAFEGQRPAQPLVTARWLGETSLMLLVHPTLTEADMADMGRAVRKVMAAAVR